MRFRLYLTRHSLSPSRTRDVRERIAVFSSFFLSIVPMGPPLVWLPAALWLYSQGELAWAIFLGLYGLVVVSSIDNVIKPYLISRGGSLPLLLVFMGVLGGLLAFGFIGVFLGPVILAVGYALLSEWMRPAAAPEKPSET